MAQIAPENIGKRTKKEALCAVYQIFIVAEHTEGYFEFQGIGEVRMINGKLDRVLHTFASH